MPELPPHPKIQTNARGDLLLNFGEYGGRVDVAAISGDGQRALLIREVGVARIWSIASGERIAELTPDSPLEGRTDVGPATGGFMVFIESAALDVHGEHALLGLNDGTAVIYRVDDGHKLAVLHPPDEAPASTWAVIRSVAYSRDGALALVGFSGRRVGVWTGDGSRRVAMLDARMGARLLRAPFVRDTLVSTVGISEDGRYVFAGAVDMSATVFELDTGAVVFEAHAHAEQALALYEGPAGVGWATSVGSLWLAPPGEAVARRVLETGRAWAELCFDDASAQFLARGTDGSIVRGAFEGEPTELEGPAERAGYNNRRMRTLWMGTDELRYLAHARAVVTRRDERALKIEREARIVEVAGAPTGRVIATRGWSDTVELWDADSGAQLHAIACPGGAGAMAFSPDGSRVALGAIGKGGGRYERLVHIYAVDAGARQCSLQGHDWQIRQLAFSADGRVLYSLGDQLLAWELDALELAQGQLVEPAQARALMQPSRSSGAFALAGEELVVVDDGSVTVFAGLERRLEFAAPIAYAKPWRISADGQRLLVAGVQAVLVFSLATGELVQEVGADIPRYEGFPSRELRAAHGLRNAAALWRTERGVFLHQSDGPRGWVEPLEFVAPGWAVVRGEHEGEAVAFVLEQREQSWVVAGALPFAQRIRAARIADGRLVVVGDEGELRSASLTDISTRA